MEPRNQRFRLTWLHLDHPREPMFWFYVKILSWYVGTSGTKSTPQLTYAKKKCFFCLCYFAREYFEGWTLLILHFWDHHIMATAHMLHVWHSFTNMSHINDPVLLVDMHRYTIHEAYGGWWMVMWGIPTTVIRWSWRAASTTCAGAVRCAGPGTSLQVGGAELGNAGAKVHGAILYMNYKLINWLIVISLISIIANSFYIFTKLSISIV